MFLFGISPSVSHTVCPMKAAKLFVDKLNKQALLTKIDRVKCELFGSLGQTGIDHGTGKAVILGFSGETPETIPAELIDTILAQVISSQKLQLDGHHSVSFPKDNAIIYPHKKPYLHILMP